MSDVNEWSKGYYTSDGYTYGFYPETMPFRLWLAALAHGHEARLNAFRYLDLGCGQGYNTVLAAICHPDSEFIGVDFMPRHVAHGNRLADRLGLTNVRFYEHDFAAVSKQAWTKDGFDFIVSHGVCSWIAPTSRADLFSAVSETLRNQGLLYLSYNTMPGWLPMLPFQKLVRDYRSNLGADNAIGRARTLIDQLSTMPGSYLNAMPTALASTKATNSHDAAYLKQEYANEYWIPFWSTDIIHELSASKIDFLGTANLSEVFEQYYPESFRELFNAEPDRPRREQLKDLAFNQAFRRDLFVRGKCQLLPGENLELLNKLNVLRNPLMPVPQEGTPFIFKAATIEIKGDYSAYKKALDTVESNRSGITINALSTTLGRTTLETSHMVILLYAGGWLYLSDQAISPTQDTTSKKMVENLAALVAKGAGYRFIPAPHIRSSLFFSEFDITLISLLLKMGENATAIEIVNELKRNGRILREKGELLKDERSQIDLVATELRGLADRLKKLEKCNIGSFI